MYINSMLVELKLFAITSVKTDRSSLSTYTVYSLFMLFDFFYSNKVNRFRTSKFKH